MKILHAFLKRFDPEVQEIALALREVVISEMRPCQEWICDVKYTVAMGYGPSEKVSETICTITSYARHVNLMFNHGALLANPHGLLEGTGKLYRHIKIKTMADVKRPEVRAYLRLARKESGLLPPRKSGGVTTTIKGKRRPVLD